MPLDLEELIAHARRRLPSTHRALLEQVGVQDTVIDAWPDDVQAMYETLRATPPTPSELEGVVAVWLPDHPVVAFNGALLRRALDGADLSVHAQQATIDRVAWHEYGHALSVVRATPELRATGPRLVDLLPAGLRRTIDYPGGYRRGQVFDEVIANVYALMIDRVVRNNDYGVPTFLHRDVVEAFQAVVPWPPE